MFGLTPAQQAAADRKAANAKAAAARKQANEDAAKARKAIAQQHLSPQAKAIALKSVAAAKNSAIKAANADKTAEVKTVNATLKQANKDARVAKKMANGKTANLDTAGAAAHDSIKAKIDAIKAQLPAAKQKVATAKTPADKAAARQFVQNLLDQLGVELQGVAKSGMGWLGDDGATNKRSHHFSGRFRRRYAPTAKAHVAGLLGSLGDEGTGTTTIEFKPTQAPPAQCAKRPNSPICMFYNMSQQNQQEMQFFMNVIMNIQHQLMDLLNQLLTTLQSPAVDPTPVDPNTGSGGGPAVDQFDYGATAYGSAGSPAAAATNGMSPADVMDFGQTYGYTQQSPTAQPSVDQFDFSGGYGVPQATAYNPTGGMQMYSPSEIEGGMGPVMMDYGMTSFDISNEEAPAVELATARPAEEAIVSSDVESLDSFINEADNGGYAEENFNDDSFI